jgi:glycosyltransferase involved in cell wall biosynthesis
VTPLVASPGAALLSFRLGQTDGVSVEAAKWGTALGRLGFDVTTVAGAGPVDHLLPGLAIGAGPPPTDGEIEAALAGADLVVVENLCSLPLNPAASAAVARVLKGRPAVFHHHDLPWQRQQYASFPPPPDAEGWIHVTVNDVSRKELADRGITATVVRNAFDVDPPTGDREGTRQKLGVGPQERLLLQPTRAIPRKNVAGGLALAAGLRATFWLLGPAEDGYGPELDRLLGTADTRVIHGHGESGAGRDVVDAYAASDAVALPSVWEGFGNPSIESAVHDRPLAIGPYPVARELEAFGFRWFAHDDPEGLSRWLDAPEPALLTHNHQVARDHFSLAGLPDHLARLLTDAGWASLRG